MRISTLLIYQQGTQSINDHQSALAKVQEQISSGQKISKPADDPINSARLMQLHKQVKLNDQYQRNISFANGRQALEETALQGGSDILQRARVLTVQANNAPLNAEDRQTIAQEISQLRQQLVDIANTKDSEGAYLFAGFKEQIQPFTTATNGGSDIVYNGDQGQRSLKVGPSREVAVGDAGSEIFMNIRSGSDRFQTAANVNNTGNGVISTGSIVDSTAYQSDFMGHEYRIEFTSATTFNVIEVTNGVDNPTPVLSNQNYAAGQPITFHGVQATISGTPADGDQFTVKTAQSNSLFKILDNLVGALEAPVETTAQQTALAQSLSNALTDLDQGLQHLELARGRIGGRMNALDAQDAVNEDFNVQLKTLISDLGDVNYAEAASQLNMELLALQAAQQSFAKIQGLSLFNYMS